MPYNSVLIIKYLCHYQKVKVFDSDTVGSKLLHFYFGADLPNKSS